MTAPPTHRHCEMCAQDTAHRDRTCLRCGWVRETWPAAAGTVQVWPEEDPWH